MQRARGKNVRRTKASEDCRMNCIDCPTKESRILERVPGVEPQKNPIFVNSSGNRKTSEQSGAGVQKPRRTTRRPKRLTHVHVATVEPGSALNEDCLDAVAQKSPDAVYSSGDTQTHEKNEEGAASSSSSSSSSLAGAEQREAFGTGFEPEPGQNLLLLLSPPPPIF